MRGFKLSADDLVGQSLSQERGLRAAQPFPDPGLDINAQDKNHITPSYLQSNFGLTQIVQALLDHGANVDATINGDYVSWYQKLQGKY